jgi:hypothetical protein
LRNRNKLAKASVFGLTLLLVVAAWSLVAQGVQTPINIVSATWVTSEATYETGRMWTEIEAAPGDRNIRLRVTFQNLSNATISGVTTELRLQFPFTNVTGGAISRAGYSGSISPGATASVDFLMNIDLAGAPGEYKLDMVVNYVETASGVGKTLYFLKSAVAQVPVVVSSTRYMVIYSTIASPSTTVPAGNVTISGNLLNIGKISVYNTNVTISSQAMVRPTSIVVGQVDPNVPRPFSSGIQLRRDIAPGTYPINISVTYSDAMAISHISQITLRLVVRPSEARPPPVVQKQSDLVTFLIRLLRDLLSVLLGFAEAAPLIL